MVDDVSFDEQPVNYQLPKKVVTTFYPSSPEKNDGRSEEHTFSYDAVDCVKTMHRTPDNLQTDFEYYDVDSTEEQGCPPPPTLKSRRRFPKAITMSYPAVISQPDKTSLDAPSEVHTLKYVALPLVNGGKSYGPAPYMVVPSNVVTSVNGVDIREVDLEWYDTGDHLGRVKTITEKMLVPGKDGAPDELQVAAVLAMSYELQDDTFIESMALTGHDQSGAPTVAFTSRSFARHSGALISMTDPLNVTQSRTYDWLGRATSLTSATGSTDYEHILKCDYALAADSDNPSAQLLNCTVYDDVGSTPEAMRRRGKVYFDGANRVISAAIDSENDNNFTTVADSMYDTLARPLSTTTYDDQNIRLVTTNGYNAWTLKNLQKNNAGATGRSDFDPVDKKTTATWTTDAPAQDAPGVVTAYDSLNTPSSITRRLNDSATAGTVTMVHDGRKRKRLHTNEAGDTTTTAYDAWNRPISATLPDKTVIAVDHAYNSTKPLPEAIRVTPGGSEKAITVATRAHDGILRPISETWDNRTTSWTYQSGASKPSKRTMTNAGETTKELVTSYEYINELKEAVSKCTAGDITQTYAYDKLGRLTSANETSSAPSGNTSSLTRTYDRWGRILTEHTVLNTLDLGTSSWTYTTLGRPRSWSHTNVNKTRDAAYDFDWSKSGQLKSVTIASSKGASHTIYYKYFDAKDNWDNVPVESPDGAHATMLQSWTIQTGSSRASITTLTYDEFNREATRTINFYNFTDANTPCATITISRTYGPDNLLVKSTVEQLTASSGQEPENVLTMDLSQPGSYDPRQRVTRVAYSGTHRRLMADGQTPIDNIAYTMDALNNLNSVTRTGKGQQDVGVYTYEPDAAFQISDITWTLAGATPPAASVTHDPFTGAITQLGDTTYEYDPLGRLTRITSGTGAETLTTRYCYDALDRLICETPDGGAPRYFLYAGDQLAAFIDGANTGGVTQFLLAAGGPVAEINASNAITLLATEASGTPVAYANDDTLDSDDGNFVNFIPRDPYGAHTQKLPDDAPATGYNGHICDRTFPIQHLGNGHRGYNPNIGRFISPDAESPFGKGGINPYAYCENDPINYTDPTGKKHIFLKILLAIVQIATVAVTTFLGGPISGVATGVLFVTGYTDRYTKHKEVGFTTQDSGTAHNDWKTWHRVSLGIHYMAALIVVSNTPDMGRGIKRKYGNWAAKKALRATEREGASLLEEAGEGPTNAERERTPSHGTHTGDLISTHGASEPTSEVGTAPSSQLPQTNSLPIQANTLSTQKIAPPNASTHLALPSTSPPDLMATRAGDTPPNIDIFPRNSPARQTRLQ